MIAQAAQAIAFHYGQQGEVRCSNIRGLTFFLVAEPPMKAAPAAREWVAMEATYEVEARRPVRSQATPESPRRQAETAAPVVTATFKAVEATHEVEVRRAATPAPEAAPVAAPAKAGGWFGKLFKK